MEKKIGMCNLYSVFNGLIDGPSIAVLLWLCVGGLKQVCGVCFVITLFLFFPSFGTPGRLRFVIVITKTRLFKYIENFTTKNRKLLDKKF